MVNDNYKLSILLNSSWEDFDAEIDNFAITEKMHNDLKSADNSASITVCHNTALENALRNIGYDGVKAKISKGNTLLFTGFIRRNFTFQNNGRVQNTKIEIVSPSFTLKRKINSRYEAVSKTVTEIIEGLLDLAGIDTTGAEIPEVNTVIPYLAISPDDNKTYFDVLNALYFEYGYVIDFDASGNPSYYSWLSGEQETTQEFNSGNILRTLSQTVKDEAHANIDVSWTSVKEVNGGNIFSDTTNGGSVNKCNLYIDKGKYLGVEEGDAEGLYCEYSADGYEILYATGVTLDYKLAIGSAPATLKEFTPYGKKAWLSLKNDNAFTSPNVHITQLDINATKCFVKIADNISKVNRSDSAFADTLSYSAAYIYDQENGDRLAGELAKYYQFADFTYSINSKVNYAIGSVVNVADTQTGSVLCRITSKVSNEKTGVYSYQLEGIGEYEATVENEKVLVSSLNANLMQVKQELQQEISQVESKSVVIDSDVFAILFHAKTDGKANYESMTINLQMTVNGEKTAPDTTPTVNAPSGLTYFLVSGSDAGSYTLTVSTTNNGTAPKGVIKIGFTVDGIIFYKEISVESSLDAKYLNALADFPTTASINDYFCYSGNDSTKKGKLYIAQNSTDGLVWVEDTDVNHCMNALSDLLKYNTGANAYAIAFIQNLFANKIVVGEEIKSANYEQATLTNKGNGFILKKNGDAEINSLRVNNTKLTADEKYNTSFGTGNFSTKNENTKYNIAIGSYALNHCNGDSENIAIGYDALNFSENVYGNVALGYAALYNPNASSKKLTGSNNIGLGNNTGSDLTSGHHNVFVGNGVGHGLTTGSNNVYIGDGIIPKSAAEKDEVNINNSIRFDSQFGFRYRDYLADGSFYLKPILKGYRTQSANILIGSHYVSDGDVIHVTFTSDISYSTDRKFLIGVIRELNETPEATYPVKIYAGSSLIDFPSYKITSDSKFHFIQEGQSLDLMYCTNINGNYWLILNNPYKNKNTISEVPTGETWIDLKPVYKRTFSATSINRNTSRTVSTEIKSSSVSTLIKIEGVFKEKSSGTWMPVPTSHPSGTGFQTETYLGSSGLVFSVGQYRDIDTLYLTLYYTKP